MRNFFLILGCLYVLSATVPDSSQTGGSPPTSLQTVPAQERKEVTVAEQILKTYVGDYAVVPEEVLSISFENGSLWGQPAGSSKRQMFAQSETKFFLKTSPTEVTFQKDANGNVIALTLKIGQRPEATFKKVK